MRLSAPLPCLVSVLWGLEQAKVLPFPIEPYTSDPLTFRFVEAYILEPAGIARLQQHVRAVLLPAGYSQIAEAIVIPNAIHMIYFVRLRISVNVTERFANT